MSASCDHGITVAVPIHLQEEYIMADTRLKVTFIDIDVHKDGDPLDRGEIYWRLYVDGDAVTERDSGNPLTVTSGETITLGASRTVTKAAGTSLAVHGYVAEEDSGLDEIESFRHTYDAGDNWGTALPQQTAHLVDGNLDVTVIYNIKRL
jgi:hypothetical protein